MSPTTGDVGRSMAPMSSLRGTNRVVIIWNRAKANVNRLLGNAHLTHESTCRLPYEVVELIITHLTHDLDALKACSLACHSWYIAAVPHLHHTLILRGKSAGKARSKLEPLSKLHKLGLMSLVKEIRVDPSFGLRHWFVPHAFSRRDLRHFSAFTNVQTLKLGDLKVHRFIPGIERYFEHFSPTLQSIVLYRPHCTPRQLSHFLSLFPNLDNVEIGEVETHVPNTTIPDTELVPFSKPKLQGQLGLYHISWVGDWAHLINSCGGLRFHYMGLCDVAGWVPVLLEACARTLETLRFYLLDAPFVVHSFSLLPEFNLSRLKFLRSLQIEDWMSDLIPPDHRHAIVMEVFSTITSPVFSELAIVLAGSDMVYSCWKEMFKTLRTMNEVRPFKLAFLLEVPDSSQGEARRKLARALDSVIAEGLLNFLDSPPTIR